MATFGELKTRVKDYLIDVPTKTDALVGAWINKAIRDAEEKKNFHHMKTTLSATTSDGVSTLAAFPSGWKGPRGVPFRVLADGSQLELGVIVSDDDYRRQFISTKLEDRDEPRQVFLDSENETIELLPIPDDQGDFSDNYTIEVPYWKYSDALVNTADTNWFTLNADWYVTFYAAAEGMLFNRDHEEAQLNFQRAQIQLDSTVSASNETTRRNPRQLVPRTSVYEETRGLPRR